jgi:hypothetical protein
MVMQRHFLEFKTIFFEFNFIKRCFFASTLLFLASLWCFFGGACLICNNLINFTNMSTGRGALRMCTICNDGTIIRTSSWTTHWKRMHNIIENAKLNYIVVRE